MTTQDEPRPDIGTDAIDLCVAIIAGGAGYSASGTPDPLVIEAIRAAWPTTVDPDAYSIGVQVAYAICAYLEQHPAILMDIADAITPTDDNESSY